MTGVASDEARAGLATPQARSGLGHTETIANAVAEIEASAEAQKADIGRLRSFLVTIMVNCERSPNITKDDIHDLCVHALNGKTIHDLAELLGHTPLRAQGIEAATADETQSGSAVGESPVGNADAPKTPLSTPLPSGSIER